MGRKLKMPPTMSNIATQKRTANEDGSRSHRMNREMPAGTRR
jgi:hypothetical protein